MKPNFVVVTTPGVRGKTGPASVPAPLWAWPDNEIGDIDSVDVDNVVNARAVPVGDILGNMIVDGRIQIFIPEASTNGKKFFKVAIAEDDSEAFTFELSPEEVGTVEILVSFAARLAAPHILNARFFYNDAAWNQSRSEVDVNIFTTPIHLQLRGWVENAPDIFRVDSVIWQLRGNGKP